MPKLILNISSMGGRVGRSFTLPAFYVMVSRVRSFEGRRLLERDGKAMGKLLKLKPNENVHAWGNGYIWCDKNGSLDGTRAMAALTALRRERLKAAAKGAEAKAAERKAKVKVSAALKREKAAAEKAKARKEKTAAAAAAAAAAWERVAGEQPSAQRHGGSLVGQQPRTPSTGAMARVGTVVAERIRGRT
jgi:hypothetical protein